jgi:hypothetical protein
MVEAVVKKYTKLNGNGLLKALSDLSKDEDLTGFDEYSVVVTAKEIPVEENQTKLSD